MNNESNEIDTDDVAAAIVKDAAAKLGVDGTESFDHSPPADDEPSQTPAIDEAKRKLGEVVTKIVSDALEDPPVEDTGRGPYASADGALAALKVALRAAPRKPKDSPAVAYVVVEFEADQQRVGFAARDGRRWHHAFVPLSHPQLSRSIVLTLDCAKKLVRALDYAVKAFPRGANVRFKDTTARIFYGEPIAAEIELHEFESGRESDGWRPPRYASPDNPGASWADYDAKLISEATTWPGGGAIVKRDEVDDHGRRHFTLTDSSGVELLRAVIVPHGQTDGLPKSRQEEIPGTLTAAPKKGGKAKKPRSPKAEAKRVGGPGKKAKIVPIVFRGKKPKKRGRR